MPNEVTPTELLALARECMPTVRDYRRDWRIVEDRVFDFGLAGRPHDHDDHAYDLAEGRLEFRPLEDDAHWAAVERWLFDRRDKPYTKVEKTNSTASGNWRYDVHYGQERFDLVIEEFDDNLSAAIAVLRKRGNK